MVQRHLHTFFLEILPVANTIVSIPDHSSSSSSHSSSEECPLHAAVYPTGKITGIVGVSGELVSGGGGGRGSDFSLHHTSEELSDYSLGIFQAKEAQLDLSTSAEKLRVRLRRLDFKC